MRAAPVHVPLSLRERCALLSEILQTYAAMLVRRRRERLDDLVAGIRGDRLPAFRGRALDLPPFRLAFVVEQILQRLPTDGRCLMRSLTVMTMLERRGIRPVLIIGVDPGDTFAAHAWLELDGENLLWWGAGRYAELHRL